MSVPAELTAPSVIPTTPYSLGAVHAVVTPSGQSMPIVHPVDQTSGDDSEVRRAMSTCRYRASSEPKPGETEMKHFLEIFTMRIPIAAAALLSVLSAAPVIAPVAFSAPFTTPQGTVAVHAAVVRFAQVARAAISVQPASAKSSVVGVQNENASTPNFARPGPGWG